MAATGLVRIGIVGAGQIARERHLPGFMAIPGVQVVGVRNRTRASSSRVARAYGIPKVYDSWEDLVDDDDIDAVVIATWPYLHGPITLAALDAGKHVLTQARMAMNAREAHRMLDKSRERPDLVAMVVPSPYGLAGDAVMRSLIAEGYLGHLREIHVDGLGGALADPDEPIGWRQLTRFSGFNMLSLGILHETLLRWAPEPTLVIARTCKVIPARNDPSGSRKIKVGTPDSVQVLTNHRGGAFGVYRLSGVLHHAPGLSITLYGSHGTLAYDLLRDEIRGALSDEPELSPIPIPDDLRGGWSVEADFIAAIREGRPVTRTDFRTGALYMHFTEAVARSSRHGQPVELPLKEFSNPSL